jgi:hypothetical protein
VSLYELQKTEGERWAPLGMRLEVVDVQGMRRGETCTNRDVKVSTESP